MNDSSWANCKVNSCIKYLLCNFANYEWLSKTVSLIFPLELALMLIWIHKGNSRYVWCLNYYQLLNDDIGIKDIDNIVDSGLNYWSVRSDILVLVTWDISRHMPNVQKFCRWISLVFFDKIQASNWLIRWHDALQCGCLDHCREMCQTLIGHLIMTPRAYWIIKVLILCCTFTQVDIRSPP